MFKSNHVKGLIDGCSNLHELGDKDDIFSCKVGSVELNKSHNFCKSGDCVSDNGSNVDSIFVMANDDIVSLNDSYLVSCVTDCDLEAFVKDLVHTNIFSVLKDSDAILEGDDRLVSMDDVVKDLTILEKHCKVLYVFNDNFLEGNALVVVDDCSGLRSFSDDNEGVEKVVIEVSSLIL